MKRILLASALALATASIAEAAPVSVLLHPNGALVRAEDQITPENGLVLRLSLPASAETSTLDISVPDVTIASLRFEDAATPESAAVAALRREWDATRAALLEKDNALADLEARRAYWRNPPLRLSDAAPLENLDALMRKHLDALAKEGFDLIQSREALQKQADLLLLRLRQTGGEQPHTRQAILTLAEPATRPVTVRYAYMLQDAGWRPLYRLEARPADNAVAITMEAEMWQRSGEDWKDTPLTLSTADPRQGMSPPRLNDWIIQPQPGASKFSPRVAASMATPAPMATQSDQMVMKENAVVYLDSASFEAWDLGRRSLPAGATQRLALSADTLKADFTYLLRPSRSETAYLDARLEIRNVRHFPVGQATFLVDGSTVGQGSFALAGDDDHIAFGQDPQVSAIMKNNSQQAGRQGIIDRKQTYAWDWLITVINKHNRPVDVRLEEPEPQSRDNEIVLSVKSSPAPTVEDHVLIWKLNVPAGQSVEVKHGVSFTAPPDMTVWNGR